MAGAGGAPAPMNFNNPTANDGSGAQFTNLGYLANTRDNNRESIIDLLNLNASLKGLNSGFMVAVGAKLDLSRLYVVGHSLGGIAGTLFTSVNQAAIANDALVGLPSNLNSIKGVVASVAGTQVSQIMVNSPTFGPTINGGLAAAGLPVGTSSYEKFVYSAQMMLDSADPVNFAQTLATQNVPVFVQQVNGDAVILNSIDSAPLGGTQALVRLLGASQIGLGETTLGLGYVKINGGTHGSLLVPSAQTVDAGLVTAEMQAEVVSFVLNGGKVAVGSQSPSSVAAP